jgi:hypothetical protein
MESLCHASTNNKILLTSQGETRRPWLKSPWLWNDQTLCPVEMIRKLQSTNDAKRPNEPSALWCYFGHHESGLRCPPGTIAWETAQSPPQGLCDAHVQSGRGGIFAGIAEWLFQNVSKIVIDEAERQIREAFPIPANQSTNNEAIFESNGSFRKWPGLPPSDSLITVHLRWGDKGVEMKLASIDELINATISLMTPDELSGKKNVHVYVASEDPKGLEQFKNASSPHWIIHASGPKNTEDNQSMMDAGELTKGRTGLESLAALLVSMESNRFVLTRASNWSRLIDELRKNVVDPRCDNCTKMIDLRPGES